MANDVLNALLTRRSLKPKYLTLPFPTKDQIETAARAALRAPVHGDDFPCRFVVIPDIKRDKLAELFRSAAAMQGADQEKQERAASKAFKGPLLVAFVVNVSANGNTTESLISAGAALEQFLLALKVQGLGAITLSGSRRRRNLCSRNRGSPSERLVLIRPELVSTDVEIECG